MVDYSPLWDTMQKRKITQYTLLKDKVLDNHTLDRLKKGQNITLVTLERICKYLSCTPNDVVSFTDENANRIDTPEATHYTKNIVEHPPHITSQFVLSGLLIKHSF